MNEACNRPVAMHSPEVRRRAIALYDSGLSCRQAAKQQEQESGTIITPQTVVCWARRLGKNRPVGDRRRVEIPREAVRLYESGLTLAEVARRFQVSPTTVTERFHAMNVKLRSRTLRYTRLADKSWVENQYSKKGHSAKHIANLIGCSVLTVHYHLRKYGIPPKRQRRKNKPTKHQ